jgi:hypothetical protein
MRSLRQGHACCTVAQQGSDRLAEEPLQLVHSDLMRPFTPASVGGHLSLLTTVDGYSGYATVKPLKYRSRATAELKKIIIGGEKQTDQRVKAVHTDGGKQCTAFDRGCSEEGIRRERTVPHTPQQTGPPERLNRILVEKIRAMLVMAGMPKK